MESSTDSRVGTAASSLSSHWIDGAEAPTGYVEPTNEDVERVEDASQVA
jgi:hypothetical protein